MKIEKILIYSEIENFCINPVYYELLTKAKELADGKSIHISCILLGWNLDDSLNELKQSGVNEVIVLDDERLKIYHVDYYSAAISKVISMIDPDIMLFGATATGEELAPTIGLRLRTGVAAHCVDIRRNESGDVSQFVPAFGGKVIGEIFTPATRPMLASIKPGVLSSEPVEPDQHCSITILDKSILDHTATSIKAISIEQDPGQDNDIAKADFIVCAGYGAARSNISGDLHKLALLFHGAVGYTRPAIDAGMSSKVCNMIGTSGRTVKPKIYLGVGVSGSSHHVCGMKDSELVISINTDPKSEMFDVSDYKVVCDGAGVIRELVELVISS